MTTSNLDLAAARDAAAEAFAREDFTAARAHWQRAADAGDLKALVELGLMHSHA